jgi:hypothetical protein
MDNLPCQENQSGVGAKKGIAKSLQIWPVGEWLRRVLRGWIVADYRLDYIEGLTFLPSE